MTRTTATMVTFLHPFTLTGVEGEYPAGCYDVETDEELLSGLSFPVYRRVETRIGLPWRAIGASGRQTVCVKPEVLEAALAKDAASENGS